MKSRWLVRVVVASLVVVVMVGFTSLRKLVHIGSCFRSSSSGSTTSLVAVVARLPGCHGARWCINTHSIFSRKGEFFSLTLKLK